MLPFHFWLFHDGSRSMEHFKTPLWLAFMPHFSRYIIFKGAKVSKDQTNVQKNTQAHQDKGNDL